MKIRLVIEDLMETPYAYDAEVDNPENLEELTAAMVMFFQKTTGDIASDAELDMDIKKELFVPKQKEIITTTGSKFHK